MTHSSPRFETITTADVIHTLAQSHGVTDAYVLTPGPGTVHVPVPGGTVYLADMNGDHPDGVHDGLMVGRTFDSGRAEMPLWVDRAGVRDVSYAVARLAEHVATQRR